MDLYIDDWRNSVNNVYGPSGSERNKWRTYRIFKTEFETEQYDNT